METVGSSSHFPRLRVTNQRCGSSGSRFRRGLTWIVDNQELSNPRLIPRRHSGVLLLVPIRKTRQTCHMWVTVKGDHVTCLLARHMKWLRKQSSRPDFLFLTSVKSGVKRWSPTPMRQMGSSAMSFGPRPNVSLDTLIVSRRYKLLHTSRCPTGDVITVG